MENSRPKHKCYEGKMYAFDWEELGEFVAGLFLQEKEEQSRCDCHNCQTQKSPLGLTPKHIHDEQRQAEILEAVNRYIAAGKKIPVEWIVEYNDLVREDK